MTPIHTEQIEWKLSYLLLFIGKIVPHESSLKARQPKFKGRCELMLALTVKSLQTVPYCGCIEQGVAE